MSEHWSNGNNEPMPGQAADGSVGRWDEEISQGLRCRHERRWEDSCRTCGRSGRDSLGLELLRLSDEKRGLEIANEHIRMRWKEEAKAIAEEHLKTIRRAEALERCDAVRVSQIKVALRALRDVAEDLNLRRVPGIHFDDQAPRHETMARVGQVLEEFAGWPDDEHESEAERIGINDAVLRRGE